MRSPLFKYQRPTERVSQAALTINTSNGRRDFEAVRMLLLEWLPLKVGATLPAAMARGDTDALDRIDMPRTETVLLADPLFWALRRDDPDSNHPQRTWVTEASLSLAGDKLHVGYRLHLVTLGDSTSFQRSVPRFMREIARHYTTCLDGVETDVTATPVEWDEEVDLLVRLLDDPARKVPVIAVSKDWGSDGRERALLDADKLASGIFGTAHVRALSWGASLALTERVGKRFSVYRGAVRLWRPGTRIGESDPYDHPLFLAEHIGDEGAQLVLRTIIDGTLRISAARRDAEKLAPSFAEARRLAIAPEREQAVRAASSTQESLALFEADNNDLVNLVAELKSEHAELMDLADVEIKQICSERDAARSEIANLRSRLAYLEHSRSIQSRVSVASIPDDFGELELHLKGNSSREPRYGFRLYFFWCEEQRCPVVGSFPSHLATSIT